MSDAVHHHGPITAPSWPVKPPPKPEASAAHSQSVSPAPAVSAGPSDPPRRDTLDVAQCRLWLNEAQREIDRLRSGTAPREGREVQAHPEPAVPCDGPPEPRDPAARGDRPSSAPPPIEEIPEFRREIPPAGDAPQAGPILSVTHITNLGTLIDVLV